MQLTIFLILVCQVFGQDEGEVYYNGEGDVEGQGPQQPPVSIISQHQELGDDGTFQYSFSADNGLQQKEAFHPDGSRTGAYSYVDPQGDTVLVHYRADQYGFHVLEGSSIPTTPPHTARLQEQPSDDGGSERLQEPSAPETSPYEVEEFDGESSALQNKKISASPSPAVRPYGFEMVRTSQHNRFYRSAEQNAPVRALEVKATDLDSTAAKDMSVAASSYRPFGLARYVAVQQKQQTSAFKSPYASLDRQVQYQYPVKKGAAEAEVEGDSANDAGGAGGAHAAATAHGGYGQHSGRYDDGSYAYHASRYDDGSYPQHAIKYDDGSYDKYARIYGKGRHSEPSRQYGEEGHYRDPSKQYGEENVGQAEYEAGYVRQPGESEVSHY